MSKDPAAQIAEGVATARELSERLHPEEADHALEEVHLLRVARRTYARLAVWYREDAALLADDAQERFTDMCNDNGGDPVEVEQVQDAQAASERVEQMSHFLEHTGAPPKGQSHEQARTLAVDILACLAQAAQVMHGEEYLIYDAHEPFTID